MSEKLFFCDLETTGVDPKQHGIWQLAARIVIDGQEVERFDRKMRPFAGQMVSAEALAVGGITIEELRGFESPEVVYREFTDLLARYVHKYTKADKFTFVAYNAQFDSDFIREWMRRNGDKYYGSWFSFPSLDVMYLAAFCLARRRHTLVNFKLATVAEHLGLEFEGPAHDAQHDIDVTRRIYDYFVARGVRQLEPAA